LNRLEGESERFGLPVQVAKAPFAVKLFLKFLVAMSDLMSVPWLSQET
jgi:hypothetical protein